MRERHRHDLVGSHPHRLTDGPESHNDLGGDRAANATISAPSSSLGNDAESPLGLAGVLDLV
jgi:hypothetical protein